MRASAPRLVIDDLIVRYGSRTAVDGISLRVDAGDVLALLGPNGAGKTTLLRTIAGMLRPHGGSIIVDGAAERDRRERLVTLVPETPAVYEELSVDEHIAFVARGRRLPRSWRGDADRLLARFGLLDVRGAAAGTLSKGLRQRLLILAALLVRARVVLFDEPMVGLDPRAQRTLVDTFAELRAAGTALVVSTHQLEGVAQYADRVAILQGGRLIHEMTTRDEAGSARALADAYLAATQP